MSNLLNLPAGVLALKEATADMIRKRIRRWFERNTVIGFNNWVLAGKPAFTAADALGILDGLNADHDQEIINLLECLRQIDDTFADVNLQWFVNTVTGSDVTGDGSALNPFATISKVQSLYGQNAYINSKVDIFVNAPVGTPMTAMDDWLVNVGPLGQITIQGLDLPVVRSAGPHTVNAGGWVDLGVAGVCGHEITLTAAALVPNAHIGHFIRVLTGTRAGKIYAITENTANVIYIGHTAKPFAPGDTFEIVTPGTQIHPAAPVKITIYGTAIYELTYASRFVITNCEWLNDLQISSKNSGVEFGFFRCNYVVKLLDCSSMYFGLGQVLDITRIGDADYVDVDTRLSYCKRIWVECQSWVNWRRPTAESLTCAFGTFGVDKGSFKLISQFGGTLVISICLCATTASRCIIYVTNMQIHNCWILGCLDFCNSVLVGGFMDVGDIEGAAPTAYTIRVAQADRITIKAGSLVHGAVNDLYFASTGAAAAFPAAGASATDANGAFVVGL